MMMMNELSGTSLLLRLGGALVCDRLDPGCVLVWRFVGNR